MTRQVQQLKRGSIEDRLLFGFGALSLTVHIGIYALSQAGLFLAPPIVIDEDPIDIDLAGIEDGVSAIPDVKKADEAKAQTELLPQLPKSFTVQEAKPKDEDVVEEKKKPEEVKKEEPKPEPPTPVPEDPDAATRLKLADVAKREALEKLRKLQKEERETQAPIDDPLARIADELEKNRSDAVGSQGIRLYGAALKKQISMHYTLPKTFTSPIPDLQVVLSIVVNHQGNLVSVSIQKSSNDPVFDDYTIQAAKNAAPFTKQPPVLAGKPIHLAFRR